MISIIFIIPLLGSILSGLTGRLVGRFGSVHITSISMVMTSLFSFFFFLQTSLLAETHYIDCGS